LRRNTAPCVALAAKILHDRDPEAVVAVLAADHLIRHEELFRQILQAAMDVAAREEALITLGIKPTYAETGYGYIQMGEACGVQDDAPYHRVQAFFEKPDAETAQRYLNDGRFLWNSGMFIFRADTLLRAAEKHMPEMTALIARVDGTRDSAEIKRCIEESIHAWKR
jgi:mannose-1-phosphate guanylyltransferase